MWGKEVFLGANTVLDLLYVAPTCKCLELCVDASGLAAFFFLIFKGKENIKKLVITIPTKKTHSFNMDACNWQIQLPIKALDVFLILFLFL